MTAGAWCFRASPRGRWRHHPASGQGRRGTERPSSLFRVTRLQTRGSWPLRSGSHSWGTRPHLRPAESLFQQRSPPGIPRRPGPLLPRRGGEGQPGGAPTQKPMEAAPEARRRWAGGGGRPWPPPPGATVGGSARNAPPSVPQVPVLRVLLSADLSCLQHFSTLEEAGGSRQSHGGRAGTAQQAHSPQAQTRTWDRTPGDGRVRRSICEWDARGQWGGVCVVGPLVLGSGFLGLRVFI